MAGGATDPEAERLKGQGNEKLKAGSAREALEIYEKALARLPVKASAGALSTLSASLCLNAALACLQLETWEAAESFASRALRSEETSKGYFRRGLARAQMNGLEADAKRDFQFALKLEPKGSTAAVLVQTELAKLLSNSAASGYEAPPGTEPRRAKKFQIANASKQQQGLREVTFAEWEALEGKVAAANAIASAWRKRLEEASNCPRPAQGADDSWVPLSKLLEQLAKESKPRAASNASASASNDIVPVEVALGSEPASGAIRGELGALQLLVPGPFLFDGKTSVDVAFDPLANPTGSFAVECWAVCTAATGHQCLLSSRDQTSGKAGYMFYVEPDGLWSFWVGTGKSWAKLYGSTAVLGKWTHLRGTMDVQSKEARLYVDHQLAARGWASYVPNTRQALRLGAGKSEAEAKFFFTGDLRDVAVIGRLVSNEDLTDEMLKLAKVRGPQVGPDLDQLPKLLRQEKGRGLQNASGALASALRWATAQPRRERGLLMRLVDDVFVEAGKQQDAGCQVHVVMQMLEVYNEKLNDLLAEAEPNPPSPNSLKKPIKIHVHPELGVYLTGATEAPVKNAEECIKTIEYGNTMKVVHATAMNAQSSRGHTICKLTVVKEGGKDNVTSNSEVYFADLAGRENERSTQVTGERFVELGFINKSLHHLSNCIRDLGQTEKRRKTICAEALRAKVAPGPNDMSKFRNSKLTLLLSNALSGNSRTSMIGTLSPASSNFEESHNTLKFASTVKTIKVQAKAAKALDKDALVRDLKNEILELRKQLEQAKEKHDDEALKEIADHLEASHAIVAAQTRDWVDFEEENAELSKKRARSFIRSSSHEMFPYLANHSEDPHLCFKLVMHVPEGKEQSLGADISSDFRLPPALGVCETTGYIRNQGGCLTLRPAAAPSGRSGRFASIEVNGNKLSREQELHHLDCVLFGRSTSFYVFLQHASAEEVDERLRASRADMEDWDGRITQPLVDKILGEARSKDPAEVKLAREYCDLLRGQNRDSEGELMLRAFMCQARRARVKVDEANELTRCVRPSSGLHFELAAQAPVLSYGFYRCANLPELCVRLVRRTRFRAAVRKVMAQLKKQNLIQAAVRSFLPAKSESISSDYQLLSTWTLPKFYARCVKISWTTLASSWRNWTNGRIPGPSAGLQRLKLCKRSTAFRSRICVTGTGNARLRFRRRPNSSFNDCRRS